MTAQPMIPFFQVGRHPSWYLAFLVPVLPALAPLLMERPAAGTGHLVLLVVLLAFGAVLSLGLPALAEQAGFAARKEAGMLRTPWLASLFICQVPLLFGRDFEDLTNMLFLASCALLASVPFGAEFQQRTLAGLLAQPVRRGDWWSLKMGVLATALGTHSLLFLLSCLATGHDLPLPVVATLLGGAILAWSTTPWWTLRTRSLLAGLVLAAAVPLLPSTAITVLVDSLDRHLEWLDGEKGQLITNVVLWGGLSVYAAIAFAMARRRWLTLEAADGEAWEPAKSGWFGKARQEQVDAPSPVRHPVWRQLGLKELRLQTLPCLTALATAVLVLAAPFTHELLVLRDYAKGAMLLMAGTTILLAAALPVAEERRMGTLNSQWLLPLSRGLQWWFKFLPAAVLAGFTGVILALAQADGRDLFWSHPSEAAAGALLVGVLFSHAFLASSVATNGVRALLVGLGAAAASIVMISMVIVFAPRWSGEEAEQWRARAMSHPDQLRAEARKMAPEEVNAMQDLLGNPEWSPWRVGFMGAAAAAALIPTLLALVMARRNFTEADAGRWTGVIQFGTCLGFTAALSATGLMAAARGAVWEERLMVMSHVRHSLEWETRLTPTEHLLWERQRSGADPFTDHVQIQVRLRADDPVQGYDFQLPLERHTRRWILEKGILRDDLLKGLREDDARDPRDPSPLIPRSVSGGMKRYRVIAPPTPVVPKPTQGSNAANPVESGATTPTNPTSTVPQP